MKYKEGAILVAATAVFVLAVVVVANLSSNKSNGSAQNSPQAAGQQAQADDSMADMHGGQQPVSSTTFDSLVNKKAPDFNLTSYDGKSYSLESLKGKNVVLFFSEGLMCYPACWDQIAAFGKDSRFNRGDTVALTIVNDQKVDWKSAIDKMPDLASATVLFDTNRTVSVAYGTLNLPSSMHRGQLPGHSYVVIDKQGIIRYVFDDPNMALANDKIVSEFSKIN
ncbi:MAG: redoxin domain-containing protein [Patescibacteria group bacterium]|nr:redoxin domain-containing protein [Patescibacteria group bacterium]